MRVVEISEHKTAVCEKTAGLQSGNSSYLSSAWLKVLVPVKIFQACLMKLNTTDGLILANQAHTNS